MTGGTASLAAGGDVMEADLPHRVILGDERIAARLAPLEGAQWRQTPPARARCKLGRAVPWHRTDRAMPRARPHLPEPHA